MEPWLAAAMQASRHAAPILCAVGTAAIVQRVCQQWSACLDILEDREVEVLGAGLLGVDSAHHLGAIRYGLHAHSQLHSPVQPVPLTSDEQCMIHRS